MRMALDQHFITLTYNSTWRQRLSLLRRACIDYVFIIHCIRMKTFDYTHRTAKIANRKLLFNVLLGSSQYLVDLQPASLLNQ